jgi:tungstate transport system substrate-binding protein
LTPYRWLAGVVVFGTLAVAVAQENAIVLASTTSTEQSGMFGHLLPRFTQGSGIKVRVVAVGSGQALEIARRGDADAVLVHDPDAEAKFVAEGFALERRAVMFNDFVLVGPAADPAGVRGRDIAIGLARIATSDAIFVSRGDNSGTHAMELRLWREAGVDLAARKPGGYRECGCGMGPALNIASALNGYALTDRGTWLAFRNRGALAIVVEGDRRLFNQYGVMVVNPARHPHVKHASAKAFADWIVSAAGQAAIAEFKIGGEQAFFPNAQP